MRVLFTGMATSHTKPGTNFTFFGHLASRLSSSAIIEWHAPSVTWTKDFLDQYDAIFVGMLPPTSPSANKMYGAMHVINLMYESPKLNLVLDHPQMWQYKHGFNAIDRSVSSVFTAFYAKRTEFSVARDKHANSIAEANHKLLTKPWPKTIYPSLPWTTDRPIDKFLGLMAKDSLIGVNLDAWLLEDYDLKSSEIRTNHWVAENLNTDWSKAIQKLLESPVVPVKDKGRVYDDEALATIENASGFLLSPQDRGVGVWWSYRTIQALNSQTPVLSDWRETSQLGPEWNLLGSDWESLSISDKLEVSAAQRKSYISAIPTKEEAEKVLTFILENSQKGEKKNARR